jgi:periplasmic divalent cation tolerance protein
MQDTNTMMSLMTLYTTVGSEPDAQSLAQALVANRLAACVQIERIQSVYRWNGEVQHAQEWRLMCKTMQSLSAELMAFVQAHHPYELPAIYTVAVLDATPAYGRWVSDSVKPLLAPTNAQ